VIAEVLDRLTPRNYAIAVDLASIPEHIRGYGYIKDRNVRDAKVREAALLAQLRDTRTVAAQPARVVSVI
jgi:indolepyruvate ferredoxin oxidoreductase